MKTFIEKNKKTIFFLLVILNFGMILAFNLLSPLLSDDYAFLIEANGTDGLSGLIAITFDEYMTYNARFINHFLFRFVLRYFSKPVIDIITSMLFSVLALLIYDNIRKTEKFNLRVLLMSYLFIWTFIAVPADTLCWACGVYTYLLGAVWIFGFVTAYRHLLARTNTRGTVLFSILMFPFGIAAGMSNENASGGCLLIILLFTAVKIFDNRKHGISLHQTLKPYIFTSFLGILSGLLLVLLSPGIHNRAEVIDESNFTGLAGLLSHIYKVTVSQKEMFSVLFIIIAVALITLTVQNYFKKFSDVATTPGIIFLLSGLAMSYVLALIEPPMERAYFGSSICFIIAAGCFLENINYSENSIKIARYALLTVLAMYIFYDYSINLVNLFRINREENERIALIEEAVSIGKDDVIVPQLRPEFENRFSTVHLNDMKEDPSYWINFFYERYYGIPNISAIPRAEYDELYPQ